MRSVIQRVREASVAIEGEIVGAIGPGLLIFLGLETVDTAADIEWLSGKIVRLRIFNDPQGVMNQSVQDIGGGLLVVSQFTLHASTRKGNRPSYSQAAPPAVAIPLYEAFLAQLARDFSQPIAAGRFGADMQVSLINDGPVTILIDTRRRE